MEDKLLYLLLASICVIATCQDFVFPTDEPPKLPIFSNGMNYDELRALNASCHPKDTCVTRGRRIDDAREQSCSCDNTCVIYDSCCIDAHIRKSPFLTLRLNNNFACTSYINVGYIYVKDTCPRSWTGPRETVIKCESTVDDHFDPLSILPSTNSISGQTYKNHYCAECNSENVSSIVVWQPLVEFTNLRSYNASHGNITRDYIKHNLEYNLDSKHWGLWLFGDDQVPYFYDATIYPMVPKGLEEKVHSCRPGLITSCHVNWTDPVVAKKCKAYQGAIYIRHNSKGYRNAHCAICNGEDPQRLTCTPPKGKAGFQARTFNNEAFSVLLDFHDPKGGSVGTNSKCPNGELYDPFHKTCKKILCGFPWLVVKNNKCVPIQTSAVNSNKMSFAVNDQADVELEAKSSQSGTNETSKDTIVTLKHTDFIQNTTQLDANVTTTVVPVVEISTIPPTLKDTVLIKNTTEVELNVTTTVVPVVELSTNPPTLKETVLIQNTTELDVNVTTTAVPVVEISTSQPALNDTVLFENSTENDVNITTPIAEVLVNQALSTPKPLRDPTIPVSTVHATTHNPHLVVLSTGNHTSENVTETPTVIVKLLDKDNTTKPTATQPYFPFKMTVVTHPPDNESTNTYSVMVEASTESITSRYTSTDSPGSELIELEGIARTPVTVSYAENKTIVQVIHLTDELKPGLDDNSSLVDLGEPPQYLDYEDNRQYVADSSVQYDYNPEFINCTKIGLSSNQYILFDNQTLSVPAFKMTYDKRNYLIIEDQALVCAFFQNTTEETTQSKFSPAMGYITFVGLGISILCLVLHLVVYLLVPEMRNLSTNNLAALSLSLLLAYLAFISGQFSTISKGTCLFVAGASYYFFLSTFFWMSAMSFDVWRTLRLATRELRVSNGKQCKRFLGYSIYSWGLAAIALIIVIIVDSVEGMPENYQPQFGVRSCWFAQREALLVFFAAPLIAVMVVNIALFVSSAQMVLTTTRSTAKNYSCTTSSRRNFKLYLRLAVMMGLTWAVGLVAGYLNVEAIWYAFVFLNTLQGLFIFVAFTCNQKVKKHLGDRVQALTKRHAYRTSSLNSNSTYPSSVMQRTATVTSTSSLTSELKTPPVVPNQKPVFVHPPVTSFQQLQDGMETLY